MFYKSLAAIAALALVASTLPASITLAAELKANQKRQRLLVPAVQKIRESSGRSTRTEGGALKKAHKRSGVRTRQTTIIQDM